MKVEPDPLVPDAYLRVRGVVYVRQTRWGPIAQKWPRKSPHGTNAGDRWRRVEFGLIAAATKNAMDLDVIMATNVAKGTNLVPRDILMKMMTGKLYVINTNNGQHWESWRLTVPNVQDVLEQLTQVPGSMIERGPDFWQAILPGNLADILTMTSDGPAWQPPPSGGGGGGNTTQWAFPGLINTHSGTSGATKGNIFKFTEPLTLDAVYASWNVADVGDQYGMIVATVDDTGKLLETVAQGAETYTATAAGDQGFTFDLTTPITLDTENFYLVATVLLSGDAGTINPIAASNTNNSYGNLPLDVGAMMATASAKSSAKDARYNSNTLDPSNITAASYAAGSYGIGLKFRNTTL